MGRVKIPPAARRFGKEAGLAELVFLLLHVRGRHALSELPNLVLDIGVAGDRPDLRLQRLIRAPSCSRSQNEPDTSADQKYGFSRRHRCLMISTCHVSAPQLTILFGPRLQVGVPLQVGPLAQIAHSSSVRPTLTDGFLYLPPPLRRTHP
jgi:hypothetical protein